MAPSSSSTKKAAKLTQRGKGKKVRFQGGTVFPFAVALTLVLGVATIVYARQSVPAADASPPTIDDHWHVAYGFYLCGEWYRLQGAQEETTTQGQLANTDYLRTGVHSHDDGVIHWHAFTSAAVGRRAQLGVFLDVYDVELTDDTLRFPEGQPVPVEHTVPAEQEYVEGETQCDGEDAELQVVVWDNFTDTDDGTTYISNFGDIRLTNDSMVYSIAFVPRDTDVPMPPWAQELPTLAAIDSGQQRPEQVLGGSTVPQGTIAPVGSTPADGSVAPGDSVAPGATTPDDTAPAATTPAATTPAATTPGDGTAPTTTGG